MVLTGAGKLSVSVYWSVGVGGDTPEPWTMDVVREERKMVLLLENGIQLAGMRHCMIQTPWIRFVHTGSSEDLAVRGHFNVLELMIHYGRPVEREANSKTGGIEEERRR